MADVIDLQNHGDQAYHSDSSDLDLSIIYLIEIAGFISRLGAGVDTLWVNRFILNLLNFILLENEMG